MKYPCKDCERKGCGAYHSECKEYLEARDQDRKARELRRQESSNTHTIYAITHTTSRGAKKYNCPF